MASGRDPAPSRAAVGRVLDTMEKAVRRQSWPYPLSAWPRPELDFALLVPRLYFELDVQDRPVAEWMTARAKDMVAADIDKKAQSIGVATCLQLVAWRNKKVPTSWFAEQVKLRSAQPAVPTSRWKNVRRAGGNVGPALVFWIVVATTVKLIQSFLRD